MVGDHPANQHLVGAALGIVMGASLVGELVLIFRRTQVLRWRYGTATRQRTVAGSFA